MIVHYQWWNITTLFRYRVVLSKQLTWSVICSGRQTYTFVDEVCYDIFQSSNPPQPNCLTNGLNDSLPKQVFAQPQLLLLLYRLVLVFDHMRVYKPY